MTGFVRRYAQGGVIRTVPAVLGKGECLIHPQSICHHRQAEPVTLSTGETVACVCIACYGALPADWITNQRARAERQARCRHTQRIDVTRLSHVGREYVCADCGAMEAE